AKTAKRARWAIQRAGFGAGIDRMQGVCRRRRALMPRVQVARRRRDGWAKTSKRALWAMKRDVFGAAVKIFKANAAEYFGYRKRAYNKERGALIEI
ncbi:MAG: hypothetical protein IJ306_00245, partial [Oscillospiraceae bacterium]|nr:hypothetical protein [Oscillospiraceae bacterium]